MGKVDTDRSWKRLMRNGSAGSAGAIVIGDGYCSLGVVRSLGRRGIPVWLLTNERSLASLSRYTRRTIPLVAGGDEARLDYLLQLADRHGLRGWTIFPTEDEAATLLSRYHDTLGACFRLTVPPWEITGQVHDKWRLHCLADSLGIDQPWTIVPGFRDEVEKLEPCFPIVLKPTIKEARNSFTREKAWEARDRQELLARYDEARTVVEADRIMLQELIPGVGQDYAYGAVCREGIPVASAVVRRPRQYPIEFGRASTYVETADVPEVEEASCRLIASLRFTGIAHIGFKRDPRDGRYKLLDFNPRVWGSHTLGRQAGVDFAYLLWRLVNGRSLPAGMKAPAGLRWLRIPRDLPTAFRLFRMGQLSPGEYLDSFKGRVEFAVLAMDDPVPAISDIPILISRKVWRGGGADPRV